MRPQLSILIDAIDNISYTFTYEENSNEKNQTNHCPVGRHFINWNVLHYHCDGDPKFQIFLRFFNG